MTAPKRVQRTRKRGGGMPTGAIYVGHPSKWGNPYTGDGPINYDLMKRYFQEWIHRPENGKRLRMHKTDPKTGEKTVIELGGE